MKNIKPQALIFWHRFLRCVKPASKGCFENRLAFSSHLTHPYFNNALALALPYKLFWRHIKESGELAPTLVKILNFLRMLPTLVNVASLRLNKDPQFIW
jgi:hypothetical protein